MLPTFIIIGAMKSGTSSLYHYLNAHPDICMSSIKETDFFVESRNSGRGLAWYESLFTRQAEQYGEASPNYSKLPLHQGVPERMHAVVPNAKLIYVLRDPVERMLSQYAHNFAKGRETRRLHEALQPRDMNNYLLTSSYHTQLKAFLDYYPLERILVLSAEDLRVNRRPTVRRIFQFLNVDPNFDSQVFDDQFHVTDRKYTNGFSLQWLIPNKKLLFAMRNIVSCEFTKPVPPDKELDESTKLQLVEALRPEIEALRRLTGERFEQWCA